MLITFILTVFQYSLYALKIGYGELDSGGSADY